MLHHLSFGVRDLERSADLYDRALQPLGYERVWTVDTAVGYGVPGGGDKFAVKLSGDVPVPSPRFHLAFAAPTRQAVDAFHAAAMAAGASDNGGPGLRPQYGGGYYAAFVIDPDGYRLEAVCKGAVD